MMCVVPGSMPLLLGKDWPQNVEPSGKWMNANEWQAHKAEWAQEHNAECQYLVLASLRRR